MAAKRDRNAASRNQRSQIRRRITFVVLTILPLVVGLTWFNLSNKNIDEIQGYEKQSLLVREAQANRDALRFQLQAASQNYLPDSGQQLQSSLGSLNPVFTESLSKITTKHAAGIDEMQAALLTYTKEAQKAVDAALARTNNGAAVASILKAPDYTNADTDFGNAIAAANLGGDLTMKKAGDNWKVLVVAELAITVFVTILIGAFSLMTERAIGRANASERARKQDRNNLDTEPFTQIAASMDDGVMILSTDNAIVMANPAAQAMLGMQARIGSIFDPDQGLDGKTITRSLGKAGGNNVTIVTIKDNSVIGA
jgi:PAS domain-containing protein